MTSVPERRSIIGRIEYDPDPERVVAGLIAVVTYQPPAERTAAPAEPAAAPSPIRRRRRPKPSRLAVWEAQWQAEQTAEAER